MPPPSAGALLSGPRALVGATAPTTSCGPDLIPRLLWLVADQIATGTFGSRRASGVNQSALKEIHLPVKNTQPEVAVLVRLPQDLRDALRARADLEDRSVASLMRLAARQYLRQNETHEAHP